MPNCYPILFKFCAYVNNMFMYNMQRDREFPMKTNNLAAHFLGLFESPSYIGNTAIIIIINKNHFYWDSVITISISIAKMYKRLLKTD